MSEETNVFGWLFGGFVLLLNIAAMIGCGVLLSLKLRSQSISTHELVWWFVVGAGAIGIVAVVALYLIGLRADKYSGMILIGLIPYFTPMIAAGLVVLFLRK